MAQKEQASNHESQYRSSAEQSSVQTVIAPAQMQTLVPPPFQLKASKEAPELEMRESPSSNYLMATGAASPNDSPSDTPNEGGTKNGVSQHKQDPGSFQMPLQKKDNSSETTDIAPFQLKKTSDSGMPEDVRGKMENAFQADFSNVNVHQNSKSATDVGALAYAQGNDVHFAPGQFKPDTASGQELIGHELTHVVQQREGRVKPTTQAGDMPVNDDKGLENEADNMGRKAAAFQMKENSTAHPIQREGLPINDDPSLENEANEQGQAAVNAPQVPTEPENTSSLQNNTASTTNAPQNPATATTVAAAPDTQTGQEQAPIEEEQAPIGQEQTTAGEEQGPTGEQANSPTAAATNDNATTGDTLVVDTEGLASVEDVAEPGANDVVAAAPAVEVFLSPLKGAGEPGSADNDPAFKGEEEKVKLKSKEQQTHDPTAKKVNDTKAAAKSPGNEVSSKAKDQQVDEMSAQQAGTFDAETFKAKLREQVAALAPSNMEEVLDFKGSGKARELKTAVGGEVTNSQKSAEGDIKDTTDEAPDTSAITARETVPLPEPAPTPEQGTILGENAAPKAKPETVVTQPLEEDSAALDQQMTDANVTEEQLAASNEPQFVTALGAKKTAQANAQTAPGQYRAAEGGIISQAQGLATQEGEAGLAEFVTIHGAQFEMVAGQQDESMTRDEAARQKVATDIEGIYESTKGKVEGILSALEMEVMTMFDTGSEAARQKFETYVDDEMRAYKRERYSGFGGGTQWLIDAVFGMPSEVNQFYTAGRDQYLVEMDIVISNVATLVATKLNEAITAIQEGRTEVKVYVDSLDPELQDIAQEAADNIDAKFGELEQTVADKEGQLIDTLATKYNENLSDLDTHIEEMQAANQGLAQRAIDAVKGVIQTIIELKNMLLGILSGAGSLISAIIQDPIGVLSNLIEGVKQGLNNFVGNIGTHLQTGLMGWLFGALGEAGLQIPSSFDIKGIFSIITQVLGMTWNYIRGKIAEHIGEENMERIERVVDFIRVLKDEGIGGLLGMIGDKLTEIKETVLGSIKEYLAESVFKAGIIWLISMFNPASAFIKACKGIYDLVMFFINRGSQIMTLIESIIGSMAAVVSGNVGALASAVEATLANGIPVAIGFLASLLGLGGISGKIRDVIQRVRQPVDNAIDWVVERGKAMLGSLGLGGREDEDTTAEGEDADLEDSEVGKVVNFSADGEAHRIWIAENGNNLEVMVASTPSPVDDKLDGWERRISDLAEDDHAQASSLIAQARTLYSTTKTEATEAQREIAEAEADATEENVSQAETADQEVETAEERLKDVLSQLFELFGITEEEGTLPVVGTHPVPGNTGGKESHHVPEKAFAKAVADFYGVVGNKVQSVDGFEDLGDKLINREAEINANFPVSNGNGLPAILIHEDTHRLGANAVHGSAIQTQVLQEIEQEMEGTETKRIVLVVKNETRQIARISNVRWQSFIQAAYNIETEKENLLGEDISDINEQEESSLITINAGDSNASENVGTSLENELLGLIDDFAQDLDIADVENSAKIRINNTLNTAFDSALSNGISTLRVALRNSDSDGDNDRHAAILEDLRSQAIGIYSNYIIHNI